MNCKCPGTQLNTLKNPHKNPHENRHEPKFEEGHVQTTD